MKRLIKLIIICFLLFLSSCSGNTDIEIRNKNESNIPSIIDVSDDDSRKIDFNYIIYNNKYDQECEGRKILWENYFSDEYEIDINLNYVNYYGFDEVYNNELKGVMYMTQTQGYVYNKYIYKLMNEKKLYNLSTYYEKYEWSNYVDNIYTDYLTNNQEIYAIPVISNTDILPRYYNKEILNRLGRNVPTTIDEFTEYLMDAKILYPNEYPMLINTLMVTHCTADIFRSFNSYIGEDNESFISYNPVYNSYEDASFFDGFNNALLYIRMLQENGYANIFLANPQDAIENPVIATEFNGTYLNGMTWPNRLPTYECETGYYLFGDNKQNLVNAKKQISFYVLPSYTEKKDADSYMNVLNKLLTNSDYTYDLNYGIQNVDYVYNSDEEKIEINNKFIGLKQFIPINIATEREKAANELIYDIPKSIIYETNTYLDEFTLMKVLSLDDIDRIKRFTGFGGSKNVMRFFDLEISIEDATYEYKKMFNEMNVGEYINSINKRLGFTSIVEY